MDICNNWVISCLVHDIHLLNSFGNDMGAVESGCVNGLQWLLKTVICLWHDDRFISNV